MTRKDRAHEWFCVLHRSLLRKFLAVSTVHIDITGNRWMRTEFTSKELTMRLDLEYYMLLDLRCLAPKVLTVTCMKTHNLANEWMTHQECVRMAEDVHSRIYDRRLEMNDRLIFFP